MPPTPRRTWQDLMREAAYTTAPVRDDWAYTENPSGTVTASWDRPARRGQIAGPGHLDLNWALRNLAERIILERQPAPSFGGYLTYTRWSMPGVAGPDISEYLG